MSAIAEALTDAFARPRAREERAPPLFWGLPAAALAGPDGDPSCPTGSSLGCQFAPGERWAKATSTSSATGQRLEESRRRRCSYSMFAAGSRWRYRPIPHRPFRRQRDGVVRIVSHQDFLVACMAPALDQQFVDDKRAGIGQVVYQSGAMTL